MAIIIPLGIQAQPSAVNSASETDQTKMLLELCKAMRTNNKVLLELTKALPKYNLEKVIDALPFLVDRDFIRQERYL